MRHLLLAVPVAVLGAGLFAAPAAATTGTAPPYYQDCDEVKAGGAAPLHQGQPGYRIGLDRDGIACESSSESDANPASSASRGAIPADAQDAPRNGSETLPVTGAATTALAVGGGAALTLGGLLIVLGRRRYLGRHRSAFH